MYITTICICVKKGSGTKTVGYEKKKKIPSGIELYAIKPRVMNRYICFWRDLCPWRVCLFGSYAMLLFQQSLL
ncbi:hypothetical protein CN916_32530 [Bacillus thuringiensis]|nr:hypothetical protein CN916_32530 [Bacillus thuringiensis]